MDWTLEVVVLCGCGVPTGWGSAVNTGKNGTVSNVSFDVADADALAAYLAKVPAGDPLAVDAVTAGGPPEPVVATIGLYHPVAGEAVFECGGPEMAPALPQSADNRFGA